MAGDLLFYILPRLGKVPFRPEKRRVVAVSKDAVMKPVIEEEQQVLPNIKQIQNIKEQEDNKHHGIYKDEKGHKHFDDFV